MSTPRLLAPLAFIGRHATTVLFLGVFIGLAAPPLATLLRPLLPLAVLLLLTATLLRLDWGAIGQELRRPGLQALLLGWHSVVTPLLMTLVLLPLPLPAGLAAALVLMCAAPPIIGAAALAALLGLEGALALVAGLVATLSTPLILPPLTLELLDLELGVSLWTLMGRLLLLISVAVTLAVVVRRLVGRQRLAALSRPLDGLFVLVMLVFAVAIMDGVTDRVIADPATALLWVGAAWLANPLLQVAGALLFWRLGRRRALTLALTTGNRNMGLLLAALPAGVDPDITLFFALAQIPMYVLPALVRPLVRRLVPPHEPVPVESGGGVLPSR